MEVIDIFVYIWQKMTHLTVSQMGKITKGDITQGDITSEKLSKVKSFNHMNCTCNLYTILLTKYIYISVATQETKGEFYRLNDSNICLTTRNDCY